MIADLLSLEKNSEDNQNFDSNNQYLLSTKRSNSWKDIIPLNSEQHNEPIYPIKNFPLIIKNAIEAIAEFVQAPISMVAQSVLGTLSHISQSKVNAPSPFLKEGESCALFLISEGQSGSRKSTCKTLADFALNEFERKKYDLYEIKLKEWRQNIAGSGKKEQKSFFNEVTKPQDPSCVFSDITIEALLGLYIDGFIINSSISTDEAAQFFSGHTMKSDTRNSSLGIFTKLFDNGLAERNRSKSNQNSSGRAHDVRLTINIQGQREVLVEALNDPILKGQGLLPRFIITIPQNFAGTRFQTDEFQTKDAHSDLRLIAYWDRCKFLLNDNFHQSENNNSNNHRTVILLNEEARVIDLAFYNEIEKLQAKGECFEHLQAFASRGCQLARRLATVLAYFAGETFITSQIYSVANDVIRHSLKEWLRYAEIETNKQSDSELLINNLIHKCKSRKMDFILKTDALKGAPTILRKVNDFDKCINELVAFNYVRIKTMNNSKYIELNPSLLK